MSNIAPAIRKAGPQDISKLAGLIRDAYQDVAQRFHLTPKNCPKHPSNCTDSWVGKDMERGVVYFLLHDGGEAIGCVALERANEQEGYLERLAILPRYRQSGFGRSLVNHIVNEARSLGLERIGIGIIAKQLELKQWYQGMGFVEQGTKTFSHLPFDVSSLSRAL